MSTKTTTDQLPDVRQRGRSDTSIAGYAMENDLGGGWWQHTGDQNARQEAFVIAHGGYNPLEGMTEHLSPAALAFYVFHGDMIYAGEMIRILHPVAVVKYGNDNQFFTCHKKIATSVSGSGQKTWKYQMEGWASVMADRYKVSWKAGFDRTEKDLVLLSPGQNSDLDLFFDKVATCNYKKLHMLMCRSEGENKYRSQPTVLGRNITSSPYFQPPSIISVAKSGTAPWPGL